MGFGCGNVFVYNLLIALSHESSSRNLNKAIPITPPERAISPSPTQLRIKHSLYPDYYFSPWPNYARYATPVLACDIGWTKVGILQS